MNKEDIIRMAREAGLVKVEDCCGVPNKFCASDEWKGNLAVFAALVSSAEREVSVNALRTLNETYEIELRKAIATEREACAKVCESIAKDMTDLAQWGAIQCANSIRKRVQK